MNYLLDTNVCIALMKGRSERVRGRFESAVGENSNLYVSSIVVFELWYGVGKSKHPEQHAKQTVSFLAVPIQIVDFDEEDARAAGAIRAALESAGKPIGSYDLLIAGQARRRGWVLVTSNVSEFSRVKGLEWQDWAS